jgi:hypothetical protein
MSWQLCICRTGVQMFMHLKIELHQVSMQCDCVYLTKIKMPHQIFVKCSNIKLHSDVWTISICYMYTATLIGNAEIQTHLKSNYPVTSFYTNINTCLCWPHVKEIQTHVKSNYLVTSFHTNTNNCLFWPCVTQSLFHKPTEEDVGEFHTVAMIHENRKWYFIHPYSVFRHVPPSDII